MILVAIMFAVVAILGTKQVWDEYRFEVTSPGLGVPAMDLHDLAAAALAADHRPARWAAHWRVARNR